jgi:hypothetical protein
MRVVTYDSRSQDSARLSIVHAPNGSLLEMTKTGNRETYRLRYVI